MERLNDFWRVCRVVSLERRLKLLWQLFDAGELSVNQLAAGTGMTQPNASIQLKMLRAAGLIRFRREKMNVIYRAEPDERVECAGTLLRALKQCGEESIAFAEVTRQVTAFTHERRIEIITILNDRVLSYNQLLDGNGMNSSALSRHLHKLEVRGFIKRSDDVYRVARPAGQLAKTLLKIARSC